MRIQSRLKTVARLGFRPAVVSRIVRDLTGRHRACGSDSEHLAAAMQWLCQAQDACEGGGVSIGWFLKEGWQKPYPETTGYIIPTFLDYASLLGNQEYLDRAIRMGAWELTIQGPSGAVRGRPGTGEHPLVFDTGQVMKGWFALYANTKEQRWLDAAVRAAAWIVSMQGSDGSWIRGSHKNIPHAYYTYVAWPLCLASNATGDPRYLNAARKHIQWVLSLREENGWIPRMAFSEKSDPLTHTVAYTYEGLLECARCLPPVEKAEVLETVRLSMFKLVESRSEAAGAGRSPETALPAFVHSSWRFRGKFSCLVGNVQFASIWLKLHQQRSDERLYNAAVHQIDAVKRNQDLRTKNLEIRGAVPGASPFWAGYGSLGYPNWAAKFLADALMLKRGIENAKRVSPKLVGQKVEAAI